MKRTCIYLLLAGSITLASCGNNEDDSKKIAKDENKEKFDSTSIEEDTKFAVAAADGGMMEVELGKLALTNASSAKVKEFAQMMVDDHGKANAELKALAQTKNISIPSSLSNKKQDKYNDLAKMKGVDFDKAYTSFMVDDHKEDIEAFRKEAEKGNDMELKNWASTKLPILEHHLMMAQSADSTVRKNK
jgi:putative membrane protein